MSDTLEVVKSVIGEVSGDLEFLENPISRETSFNRDLELESIDFVMIAEKLQNHFGDDVNFANWLSEMDIDEIIALKVGDLVDFIDQCR